MTGGVLLKPVNITNLIQQNSYIVIMALGMLLVIVGGNIDLSVGSVVGFVGALAAMMMVGFTIPALEIAIKIHWVPVILLSLLLGAAIGAAQGWFVAYATIPSFIVTLGGMLIFRGLTGNMLAGQFVGPFANEFQNISSGFIPDVFGAADFRWTSMLIGAGGRRRAVLRPTTAAGSSRARESIDGTRAMRRSSIGKNVVFAGLIIGVTYLLASYKGLPIVLVIMGALILFYNFVTTRTMIGRRIYALGGNAQAARPVRHPDPAARLPHLRQHGRARRARRPDRRGAPELGDAERRQLLRARRHRGLLHRRRLGLGRRGQGDGRGHRRVLHGRHEQRHVDPRHRHLLAAGRQGHRAARCRVSRRLQQEQVRLREDRTW